MQLVSLIPLFLALSGPPAAAVRFRAPGSPFTQAPAHAPVQMRPQIQAQLQAHGPLADNRICSRGIYGNSAPARDTLAQALADALGRAGAPGGTPGSAQASGPDTGQAGAGANATPPNDATAAPRAAFFRGCQLFAAGQHEAAAKEFEHAVRADGRSAIYHFWLGRAHGEVARRSNPIRLASLARKVRKSFERAVALDPTFLDAREGLVHFYLRVPGFIGGSIPRARAHATEMTRRDPYRGGHLSVMIAQHLKDAVGEQRAFEALIASHPDSVGPYLGLATAAASRRDWATAWAALDRLERAHPDHAPVQFAIGQLAAQSAQQLDRGEAALRAYLRHAPAPNEPPHVLAHVRLGTILEQQNDRDRALRAYRAALALDPRNKEAKDALARLGERRASS